MIRSVTLRFSTLWQERAGCQVGFQQVDRCEDGLDQGCVHQRVEKVTGALNAQAPEIKSKLEALKADALAVTTSQAHKLLSDSIGNGGKTLADSDSKVPDGDKTRNDLTRPWPQLKTSSMTGSCFLRLILMPGL